MLFPSSAWWHSIQPEGYANRAAEDRRGIAFPGDTTTDSAMGRPELRRRQRAAAVPPQDPTIHSDRHDRHLEPIRDVEGHNPKKTRSKAGRSAAGAFLRHLDPHPGYETLHVVPDIPLRGGVSQQVGGVIGADHRGWSVVEPAAPKLPDRLLCAEQ